MPTSLIVTFGVMYLLGLSVDNISLLGLTLAVGLVVDDAIVMLENIVRHIEEGMPPMEAALTGSREIGFTIVSITISLVAVFLPVLLMGGVVGEILNEFALVVTIAIIASAVISLTLTPMLTARLPVVARHVVHGRKPMMERAFDAMHSGYRRLLDLCLRARPVVLAVFILTILATVFLFSTINKGFLPTEDISQLSVSTQARQDIAFPAMQALQKQVSDIISAEPFVLHVASNVGGFGSSGLNNGSLNVQLKPKGQRPDLDTVLATLRRDLAKVSGIASFVVPVQNLRLGGRSSASQYQYRHPVDRPERPLSVGPADHAGDARRPRAFHRRHQRHPEQRFAGRTGHRLGPREPVRDHLAAAAQQPLLRLRHQPGLDHFRRRQHL